MNPEDMIEDAEIVDILEIAPVEEIEEEDNGPEPLTDDQIEGILAGPLMTRLTLLRATFRQTGSRRSATLTARATLAMRMAAARLYRQRCAMRCGLLSPA